MPEVRKFKTGAKPTPRYKLARARPHMARGATPSQVIVVPPFLEVWLNDQYGDCVTAEEAFAKAAYTVQNGLPETKITDATVMAFCSKHDLLNGAELPQVMDLMISEGFSQDGTAYKDGPYTSVDYSNEANLQNAISIGPVKIGISASSLPNGAGNANGWYAFGGQGGQQDHCVALCGYGPTAALFQALNTPVPSGAPANGYLLFTWATIGVVDHAWIMAACGEAWLRTPTTPGITPIPPPPPVCPPGTHLDPTTNTCVPDVPPPPLHSVVVLPPRTLNGSLGGFLPITVTDPGGVFPVTQAPAHMMGAEAIPWSIVIAFLQMLASQGLAWICANPGVFGPTVQPYIVQLCSILPHGKQTPCC